VLLVLLVQKVVLLGGRRVALEVVLLRFWRRVSCVCGRLPVDWVLLGGRPEGELVRTAAGRAHWLLCGGGRLAIGLALFAQMMLLLLLVLLVLSLVLLSLVLVVLVGQLVEVLVVVIVLFVELVFGESLRLLRLLGLLRLIRLR